MRLRWCAAWDCAGAQPGATFGRSVRLRWGATWNCAWAQRGAAQRRTVELRMGAAYAVQGCSMRLRMGARWAAQLAAWSSAGALQLREARNARVSRARIVGLRRGAACSGAGGRLGATLGRNLRLRW